MKPHRLTLFAQFPVIFAVVLFLISGGAGVEKSAGQPAPALVYPDDAGLLNVRAEPFNAKGDDIHDDSDAIQNAIYEARAQRLSGVYLPDGVYKVSRTIDWARINPKNNQPMRMAHIWMHGQSRDGTIIRLADGAKGFGRENLDAYENNAAKAPAVLRTESEGAPPDAAIENHITNLTVDVGNNAGAIGISFLGNNVASIRSVTIRAAKGAGAVGLSMIRIPGPCLVQDVRIEGFRDGIVCDGPDGLLTVVLDRVTVQNQRRVGIENRSIMVTIHDLQSVNDVPAIRNITKAPSAAQLKKDPNAKPREVAMTQVLNADLRAEKADPAIAAIENQTYMFARDVKIAGYAMGLREGDKEVRKVGAIDEYVTGGPISIFENTPKHTLGLPIPPEPEVFHSNDFSQWANVKSFMKNVPPAPAPEPAKDAQEKPAEANNADEPPPETADADLGDMTDAIQSALNSGKSVVYLPKGVYGVSRTIIIPPTVRTIAGMRSQIVATDSAGGEFGTRWGRKPIFRVEGNSDVPLTIEFLVFKVHGNAPYARQGVIAIEHASPRPLHLIDGNWRGYVGLVGAGSLFVDDVTGIDWRIAPGQSAFFRQIDPETSALDQRILNNGGRVVIMGLKTEGPRPVIRTTGGGQTELFGGFTRPSAGYPLGEPMFIVDSGGAFVASFGGNAYREDRDYQVLLKETRGNVTRTLTRQDALDRGLMSRGASQIPLLIAYQDAEYSPKPVTITPDRDRLPTPWRIDDFGVTDFPGEAMFAGTGAAQISGAGIAQDRRTMSGVIGTVRDAASMIWVPLPGDGELSARIAQVQTRQREPRGKAGLMIRQNSEPGSPMVFFGAHVGVREGGPHRRDVAKDDGAAYHDEPAIILIARTKADERASLLASLPYDPATQLPFVRLRRDGDRAVAEISDNGSDWKPVGKPIELPAGPWIIGMAAGGEFPNTPATGLFTHLRSSGIPGWSEGPSSQVGPWLSADADPGLLIPGKVEAAGADGLRITGSGWLFARNLAHFYHWAFQALAGDRALSAKVRWADDTGALLDAHAGLTVRIQLDPKKETQVLLARNGGQVVMIARTVEWGGNPIKTTPFTLKDPNQPVWLRLVRQGSDITGFASLDGKEWLQVGSATLPKLPPVALWGAFATSGDLAHSATAVFSDLEVSDAPKKAVEAKPAPDAEKPARGRR